MYIAIIGTGNVGRVLGRRWKEAGHTVVLGTREPESESSQTLGRDIGVELKHGAVAAADAAIVVIAVPGLAAEGVVRELGDLKGKIIIDCTNPIGPGRTNRPEKSVAERLAEIAPGAHVVKAFNTTGAKNMADPVYEKGPLVMPLCGDDAAAKKVVWELAETLGFEPIDNGPLRQARALEAMAFVWINQAYAQGWGPDFGFAVFRR